jgi:hypothetical protein
MRKQKSKVEKMESDSKEVIKKYAKEVQALEEGVRKREEEVHKLTDEVETRKVELDVKAEELQTWKEQSLEDLDRREKKLVIQNSLDYIIWTAGRRSW